MCVGEDGMLSESVFVYFLSTPLSSAYPEVYAFMS